MEASTKTPAEIIAETLEAGMSAIPPKFYTIGDMKLVLWLQHEQSIPADEVRRLMDEHMKRMHPRKRA